MTDEEKKKKKRLEETFGVHVPHVPVKSFHGEPLQDLPKDWEKAEWPVVPFLLFLVVLVHSQEFIVRCCKSKMNNASQQFSLEIWKTVASKPSGSKNSSLKQLLAQRPIVLSTEKESFKYFLNGQLREKFHPPPAADESEWCIQVSNLFFRPEPQG